MNHGNSCYSMGCRCAVGRAARAEATRRYKSLTGFVKAFELQPWRDYVTNRASALGVGLDSFLEARGVSYKWLSTYSARWDTLDRLCCAVGVPTLYLYPGFNGMAT